ncbi:MAG: hypothetical protein IT436_12005 [Phycisphaerales bacterium]|nr:hypothetical protein [Phycisphaerales bacterium]
MARAPWPGLSNKDAAARAEPTPLGVLRPGRGGLARAGPGVYAFPP